MSRQVVYEQVRIRIDRLMNASDDLEIVLAFGELRGWAQAGHILGMINDLEMRKIQKEITRELFQRAASSSIKHSLSLGDSWIA